MATTNRSSTLPGVGLVEDEPEVPISIKVLAGLGLAAACVVLGLQLKMSKIWISDEDFAMKDDWTAILEPVN
jgi:hypothetical protein